MAAVRFGWLELDVTGRQVWARGAPVDVTRREFDLLSRLVGAPGVVVSREQLLAEVWGSSPEWQQSRTVTEHVRRLRAKLGSDATEVIVTVRGSGYRFDPPPATTTRPTTSGQPVGSALMVGRSVPMTGVRHPDEEVHVAALDDIDGGGASGHHPAPWPRQWRRARSGRWRWSVPNGTVATSPGLRALVGGDGSGRCTGLDLLRRVHPDDRRQVLAALRDAVGGGGQIDVVHRLHAPGAPILVRTGATVESGAGGRVERVVGYSEDVTDVAALLADSPAAHPLVADLRRAVTAGELRLHFQPVVELTTGTVVGHEALLRWQHPRRGLLGPDDFLPLAERSGLGVDIGRWVLEEACRQARRFQSLAPRWRHLAMAVNLSVSQLADPDLPDHVAAALAASGLGRRHLHLEITELADLAHVDADVVDRLRRLGVGLALDDFGTGWSSLTALQRLPVGMLKIDRSFIAGIGRSPSDRSIVAAIVDLAAEMGLTVLAEGVETAEQHQHLLALGCTLAQGYLFGRPVAAADALAALAAAPAGRPSPGVPAAPPLADRAAVDRPCGRAVGGGHVHEHLDRARHAILCARTRQDIAAAVTELVIGLGGLPVAAGDARDDAVPIDISIGGPEAVLPAAPRATVARMLLERHLPAAVADAQRQAALLDATRQHSQPQAHGCVTGRRPTPVP
ncbi:MAG TPA: EAL domain-containing protein [Acidimicrobiales bacterium]|nr:EAL domain-containing protein [Acidimicrobiales bacterium]